MKKIMALTALLLVFSMASSAHADLIGGLNITSFADSLISSSGTFTTSGGSVAAVLTDHDPGTYAYSSDSGAYVQLGFSHPIVNGPGYDLALFELGTPDTFKLSITLGGTTIQYLSSDTGFTIGMYNLNVATINLDDFGLSVGATVDQIVVGLDVQSIYGNRPSLSLAGALNSVPVPGAVGLLGSGLLGLVGMGRRRSKKS